MRFALNMAVVLVAGLTACRDRDRTEEHKRMPEVIKPMEPAVMPPQARTTSRPTRSDTEPAVRPEVAMQPRLIDVNKVKWMEAETGLPKGAKIFVAEGSPPFPANQTFTVLAKMPRNYTIPPHSHFVTEHVTVLKGELSFGHGDKLDRAHTTKVKAGGIVLIPAGHTHYAFTTNQETIIALNGVGPWGIVYVNPKDDPRATPATKPADLAASEWDAPLDMKVYQARDVAFTEPPMGMMPAGIKMAMLEGDVAEPKTFTLRLLMKKGQIVPVHSHSHSERFLVLSGKADFGFGDTFDEKKLEHMATPTLGLVPENAPHYARALTDNTVVQIMGVGPFDMKIAPDGGMPPKRR